MLETSYLHSGYYWEAVRETAASIIITLLITAAFLFLLYQIYDAARDIRDYNRIK